MGCGATKLAYVRTKRGDKKSRKPSLTDPELWKPESPLTQSDLSNLRAEFWHTSGSGAYGGNKVYWDALQESCQALLDGDLALADSIIKAANLKPQNHSLSLSFDAKGNEFRIPPYCYSRPTRLMNCAIDAPQDSRLEIGTAAESSQESKPTVVRIRVRVAPSGRDVVVTNVSTLDSFLTLKREIQAQLASIASSTQESIITTTEVAGMDVPPTRQRLFFVGKEIKNEDVIGSYPDLYELLEEHYPKKKKKKFLLQLYSLPKPESGTT